MINRVNEKKLSVDERRSILNRSLNAVPFFNLLKYEVQAGSKQNEYKGKVYINLDFYLTDIRGNFNKVFLDTGTEWLVSLYMTLTGQSPYGYNRGDRLPTSFLMSDARSQIAALSRLYDDKQSESIPYKIGKGQELVSEIVNIDTKDQVADAMLMLAGFVGLSYPYLNRTETEKINQSLSDESIFQTFKFEVNHEGQRFYNLENDSRPRLILGFGVVDYLNTPESISFSDVSIIDSTRQIKLTNQPIPIEFLAPRINSCLDTHFYYLPIEHYWMPFGNLRFLINNTSQLLLPNTYELVMLTRTV